MTPELISALAGGIAIIIGALAAGLVSLKKAEAESRRLATNVGALGRQLDQVRDELSPNHGSSTRDAINRTEAHATSQTTILGNLGQDVSALRAEVAGLVADVGTIRGDIGVLAQVDADDRRREGQEHARLWQAVNRRPGRWPFRKGTTP
ncbi:hypothetical protein ACQCX5_14370 [Propionibacteriaceae bacterium G57]|uniref:hypothetical protein n=1 Tax=Aestuariimicrobium sp. G57 TaxID=3418485 RepID=UPI003DA72833